MGLIVSSRFSALACDEMETAAIGLCIGLSLTGVGPFLGALNGGMY